MVSGYPTSTNIPRVDGLSTDPREMGRHSTFYITVPLSHFSIQSLFSCYMVFITISIILSHPMSCVHIPRNGYGYKLYVPEGTITIRDSDHVMY